MIWTVLILAALIACQWLVASSMSEPNRTVYRTGTEFNAYLMAGLIVLLWLV